MKYTKFLFLSCCFLLPSIVFGQSSAKPDWAKSDYHLDLKNSYLEAVVVTSEVSTDAMRRKAKEILAERRSLATGERVIFGDGEAKNQSGLTIYAKPILEWIDYENEVGYFLFQTKKKISAQYEDVSYTDTYGFSPRVFVPGMAQLHKSSTTKGVLFIAGEVAMIGGIVVCEGLRASYESKINTTHSAVDKKTYISNADNMQNARNIFIAGAAALYAWNVIDGIVANGKKHIRIGDANLKITPYASPYAGGVVFALNF
ncbi:MAG: hypothetical protein LBL94_03710 [Prevotellaceae bacterium]|jgi:hypothetical protein|nr:hypothetical protein [Prevotellaceae bacterium]